MTPEEYRRMWNQLMWEAAHMRVTPSDEVLRRDIDPSLVTKRGFSGWSPYVPTSSDPEDPSWDRCDVDFLASCRIKP